MTDSNEIAVRHDPAMLDKTTDSWFEMAQPVFQLAARIADTQFVPKGLQGNPPAIAAAILHGRELGLPPLTALAQTHVIEGKPSISAEMQRGLVLAAGHEIEILESTGAVCTMRGRRKGSETWTTITWTLDMARAANLIGKTNWKNYPRSMLQARCSAELCRLVFADVVHGMSATEELEDLAEGNGEVAPEATTKVSRAPKKLAEPPSERQRPELPPRGPAAPPEPEQPAPAAQNAAAPDEPQSATGPPPERTAPPVSAAQLRMLGAQWNRLGVTDDLERHTLTGLLVGRDIEGTTKNLNVAEATGLIDKIKDLPDREALEALLREADQPELVK